MSPCFHSFQEPIWKLIKTCLWSGSNMRGGSRHRKPGRHRERKGRVVPPSLCPGNSKLKEYWQKNDTAKKQHLTCNLTFVQIKVFWWKTMEDLYGTKSFYKWEMLWCKYNIENSNCIEKSCLCQKMDKWRATADISLSKYEICCKMKSWQSTLISLNIHFPLFQKPGETEVHIYVPDLGKWACHNL